jgi:hypothetical protein
MIEPSPFDAATAYLVVDNHRMDDARPHLWKTADYGKTWKSLSVGLAKDVYLHAVREDPRKKGLLFAGTERGVAYSPDDGSTWKELKTNLPTVAVHDLVVKDDDLVVGTHGRSIWILGDLTPLREWSKEVEAKAAHLFTARPALRWRLESPISSHGSGPGENPPAGAVVYYWLKEEPKEDVRLEVLDEKGAVVRTLSSRKVEPAVAEDDPDPEEPEPKPLSKEAGLQRAVWDLRYEGAPRIRPAKIDSGDPGVGPSAPPGRYTLRLAVGQQTLTTPLELRLDPRVTVARADLEEQLAFSLQLRDDLKRLAEAVKALRAVREQVKARVAPLRGQADKQPLVAAADALVRKCDVLEAKLHNPKAEVAYDILAMQGGAQLYSRLAPLYGWASEGDGRPTQGMREVYAEERRELDTLLSEWNAIVDGDVADLNRKARELAPDFVVVQ